MFNNKMGLLALLLTDNESLEYYTKGKYSNFDDVKRRMLLKAREQNPAIPDHYYRLAQENSFEGLGSIAEIFTIGMPDLASGFLELNANKINVISNKQNDWQELITLIPPLFLQSAFLYKNALLDKNEKIVYFKDFILPNTKYTALPSAKIPQLDYYVNEQKGLHDLHMHLNGSLETDQVWQDYLITPNGIFKDLSEAFTKAKVKEQMEQESHLLDPLNYLMLLKAAQKLRNFFYEFLFPTRIVGTFQHNKYTLIQEILNNQSDYPGSYRHPFLSLITNDNRYPHLMSIEALMYILLLQEIDSNKNETLAGLFHFYLLILGLTNRLLVQQTHQNGFEQFQKNTINGLRDSSEKIYRRRYFQMHGNECRHIQFLEGRFSPKATLKESIEIIDAIWNGWEAMKKEIKKKQAENKEAFVEPRLSLIAHFIKKADDNKDYFIRHNNLRKEVWQRAKVLSLLLLNQPKYKNKVNAVDAASSEFDAPPEVFAPSFRLMRRSGLKHFTYHAGEDFYHILSGLRAIFEAIDFCDLRKGDRIGHATATGLSAKLWHKEIGDVILIRQGEYLDNLVFTYHLIIECKIAALQNLIPFIVNKAQDLSFDIYHEHYPISVLERAWLMRKCCPIHAFQENRADVSLKQVFSEEEWVFVNKEFLRSKRPKKESSVWQLFSAYHNNICKRKYDEIISIDPFDLISIEQIELLQLGLLCEMNKREIIIETLPTSNVRIGFHRDFKTYHLWNWIKWKSEDKSIPPIVVGSDDTGIFATNIYNEYANIYCALLNDHDMSHSQIMDVIKQLDEDSHIYRFQ